MNLAIIQQHRRLALEPSSSSSSSFVGDDTLWNQRAVIIVGSLLFFIIFILALIPVAKCLLRFLNLESPRDMHVRLANTGLKQRIVQSLPTIIYQEHPLLSSSAVSQVSGSSSYSSPSLSSSPCGSSDLSSSSDCCICLCQFNHGDILRLMPTCCHAFHVHCIDPWLLSHSSCPICRHSLLFQHKT